MAKIGRIGTTVKMDGQDEYKKAAHEITMNLKSLGSEMNLLTATFGKNDKSIEGLTEKKQLLEKRLSEQAKAAEAAEAALAKMREAGVDPANEAFKDMERVLTDNKAAMAWTKQDIATVSEELEKSQTAWSEAGDAIATTGQELSNTSDKLDDAESGWSALGKTIAYTTGALAAGMAALGAATVAAGAYLYGMAKNTAYAGNSVDEYSRRMGFSRQAIQEWDYVLSQNGASLYNLNYGVRRVTAAMGSMDEEGGKVGKAISQLGLNFDEVRKKSPEDAMNAIVGAFQEMDEGAEKTALSLKIFGQTGGMKLMPLLNSTADAVEQLRWETELFGMVMSDDAIDAAAEFTNSMDTMSRTFKGVKNSIGAEFLPGISEVMFGFTMLLTERSDQAGNIITDGVNMLIEGIETAIPQVLDLLGTVATTIAKIAPDIINALVDGIVGNIPQLVDAALDIIMALVEGIITALPALLDGAAQIIVSLAEGIAEALPELLPVVVDVLAALVKTLIDNIPMLIDAALQLIIGLAKGLVAAIPVLIDAIPEIISSIVMAIIESIPLIIHAGIDLMVALVAALPEIILAIVEVIPNIIMSIVEALIDNIDKIVEAGVLVFIALVENLPFIIWEIIKAVPQIVEALRTAFIELVPRLAEAGKELILGLINGIKNMAGAAVDAVRDVGSRILGGIRGFFGINSPSTVFAEIGGNMAEGLSGGFDREAKNVEAKMTGAMGKAGEMTSKKMAEGIVAGYSQVTNAVQRIIGEIVNTVNDSVSMFLDAGREMADSIAAGFESGAGSMRQRILNEIARIYRDMPGGHGFDFGGGNFSSTSPGTVPAQTSSTTIINNYYNTFDTKNIRELNDIARIAENAAYYSTVVMGV